MGKTLHFRSLLVGAIAAVALPVALVSPASATPAPISTKPSAEAVAETRLQSLLDELVATGASGALVRLDDGTRVRQFASGAARLEPHEPLRPAARFRAGSVTKTFVATVALQLVERGQLRLDDTVERWLPGLVPNGSAITLRMLLNHSSGLFNYTEDEQFLARVGKDPTAPMTPRELIAYATAHPPKFPPDAGWYYSNTGYVVAGLMIEAASGRSFAKLLREGIIDPLTLSNTYLPEDAEIAGYHARGYYPPALTGAGHLDATPFHASLTWTAGALVSTAKDLDRFYSALLGGELLRPALLEHMRATVPALPILHYGLGLAKRRTGCGTVWGHDGKMPGYHTYAYHEANGRRSVVVMLPTDAHPQFDPALSSVLKLTVDVAICRMYGHAPPASAPATAIPLDGALIG
jgi:D-alanyl-D-alanine carboxypeptidase